MGRGKVCVVARTCLWRHFVVYGGVCGEGKKVEMEKKKGKKTGREIKRGRLPFCVIECFFCEAMNV